MKQTLSLLVAAGLLFVTAACGDDTSDSDSTATPSTTTEATDDAPEVPSDTVTEEAPQEPQTGPSGSRPSVDELAQYFMDDMVDQATAQCMGQVFYDSEMSDAGLRDMIDQGDAWNPGTQDAVPALEAAGALFECIPGFDDFDMEDFDMEDFDLGN